MAKFVNRTRKSISIPLRLLREGNIHLIPIYYLFLLSDLAKEGVKNSGSYKFADHVYQGVPKGRFVLGKLIDWVFLNMRSARSFKNRHIHAKEEILKNLKKFQNEKTIHVMSIPSGIPRYFIEISDQLSSASPSLYKKISFHCFDLDIKVHELTKEILAGKDSNFVFHRGNALRADHYNINPHIIVSTGFGEFLDDEMLVEFYQTCYSKLLKGGVFITTATDKEPLSEYLMRNLGELNAYYRTKNDVEKIFAKTLFKDVSTYRDRIGLQTIVVAKK